MIAPYVCARCRQKILGASQRRASSFVSLGKLVRQEPIPARTITQPDSNIFADSVKLEGLEPHPTADPASEAVKPTPDNRRYHPIFLAAKGLKVRKEEGKDTLEDLFSSNLHKVQAAAEQAIALTKPPARQLVQEDIATLGHKYYKQNCSLKVIWGLCLDLFRSKQWQDLQKEAVDGKGVELEPQYMSVFQGFLLDVTSSRAQNSATNRYSVPPGEIMKRYLYYGILKDWSDKVLWRQLGTYIERYIYPNSRTWNLRASEIGVPTTVLEELMLVWWVFVLKNGEPSKFSRNGFYRGPLQPSSKLLVPKLEGMYRWPGLTSSHREDSAGQPLPADIVERFARLWPRYHGTHQQTYALCMAMIVTYDILEQRKARLERPDLLLTNSEPFIQALAKLVQGCKVNQELAADFLEAQGFARELGTKIMQRWRIHGVDIDVDVVEDDILNSSVSTGGVQVSSPTSLGNPAMTNINIKLLRARGSQDAAFMSQLWKQFQELTSSENPESEQKEDLYSNFLTSFFAVRLQHRAVEVWNYMINNNHKPSQKHWHAMLAGCSTAKDLLSLREIWANMISARVEPDTEMWTTWINGLMVCGDWQGGVQALDTLGKLWRDPSNNQRLQPSLPPIRATLSGLVAHRRHGLTPRIHQFAKSHGLTYDTQTYNILLRPAVRAGDDTAVQALFAEMRASNNQPDIATFTIILNGLLSNPSSPFLLQAPVEQQATVFSILDDMERTGLQANTFTYSTILDGLLRPEIFNVEAATAVMQHMASHNVKASPHVYTILITHYFSLNPPNLSAIASLLQRAKLEKVSLDPIFYGRMIENYARVGETEKMLMILKRMPEEGKSPGWMALLACLRVLVQEGEWEAVRDLVRDVESEEGLFRHGNGAWKGKDAFWELVKEVREGGHLE